MTKQTRTQCRQLLILAGLTLLLCLAIYFPYIVFRLPLEYGTDIKPQWFPFYEEFRNLITAFFQEGSLPFYSWSLFLGNNFYASKSYYLMGDLFSYLGLLFPTQFFDTALILTILKIMVASLSFNALLSQMNMQFRTRLVGSLCYAFSSWALFFSGQLSFLSFYCLMPLYFAGLERYLRYGKKALYLMMCTVLLLTNFYFFFTLSLFTVPYYLWRYFVIHCDTSHFLSDTLKLIGVYLLGVGLTGFLTLPTLFYILGNDRVGAMNFTVVYDQIRIYLHELAAALVPNYLYIYKDSVFETGWHVTRELCLWAGALTALLLPQVLTDPDRRYARLTRRLLLGCGIMLLLPLANSLMHGLGDPSFRWTLMLITINLLISCHYLDQPQRIHRKTLILSAAALTLLCALIVPVTAWAEGELSSLLSGYGRQWGLFLVCALLFLLYAGLLLSSRRFAANLLILCVVLEMGTAGVLLIAQNRDRGERGTFEFVEEVTHVLQDEPGELNEFLRNIEPENATQYYRVFVPHESLYWSYSHNMSLFYQLNGVMTYDSTYSPSFNQLRELAPQVRDFESDWIFNITDPDLIEFLSVKYAIVTQESELPSTGSWRLLTDSYRNSLKVYRNDAYRPLGTTYSDVISIDTLIHDYDTDLSLLNQKIIAKEEDVEAIRSCLRSDSVSVLENIHYQHNSLTGYLTCEDRSFLVLSLPYDEGWNILVNGREVPVYEVNGGFIGVPVDAGDNQFEMYFVPKGLKAGVLISGFSGVAIIFLSFIQWKKGKRQPRRQ